MDPTTESLPNNTPAAYQTHFVQSQQDSRFERLEKEHTAKQARLKEEYDAQRAQIESQLRDEVENSKSRFKQNIQKIQCALADIEDSVESSITKRVGLHLEKDLLCREYEIIMKKTAADLRDKVHDMIINSTFESSGTQAPSLETVSTSPCTAVSKPSKSADTYDMNVDE
jgi:archaellum component FlaC